MKKTAALLLLFCLLFPLLAACNGGTGDDPDVPPSPPDPDEVYELGDDIKGTGSSLLGDFTPAATVEAALTVSESDTVFRGVDFLSPVTVEEGVTDTVFDGCRFVSLENHGTDTVVVNSYVYSDGIGISSTGDGLLVANCRLDCKKASVLASGDSIEIRSCDIESKTTTAVFLQDTQNSLVALSCIDGAQDSVLLEYALNTAVVRNRLICVEVDWSINVYVCDNAVGGRLSARENNYLLSDGNVYPEDGKSHAPILLSNENINGDTVTDVNARLDVGANEEILPHINRDLFVGMERKATVREYGATEKQLYAYILEQGEKSDYVVVAPGAYEVEMTAHFTDRHDGTTVYAYGVLAEGVEYENRSYNIQHIVADGVENLTVKGLTIGYAQPSCGQVYVLEKLDNFKVLAVTGAGFWNEFSNSGSNFFSVTDVKHQKAGDFLYCNDLFVESVEKNADGTLTITMQGGSSYDTLAKGDVMTCRTTDRNQVVVTQYSKNVTYMDVTQYGYAGGFAFVENTNESGTTYYRVADIAKSGMIIDKDTYDRYRAWEKTYGVDLGISTDTLADGSLRYRGSPALVSSLDGTHSTACAEGSTVISSIFENMTDDASSQNSVHARLSEVIDNGDGSLTLIYKGNLSPRKFGQFGRAAEFERYCAPFRQGDRVFIYTSAGQLICDAPALDDGYYYDTIRSTYNRVDEKDILRYAVRVEAEEVNVDALRYYDLRDDSHEDAQKVLVDNMSRASANAYFDNCRFENGATNGPRVKSPGGTVTNCTIRNMAKTATSLVFDIWWGESGTVEGYLFKNNLIDHTSYSVYNAPSIESTSTSYKYTPICIMGLGGKQLSEDYLLFKDIRIEGNKFINRCLDLYNYAIYIRAACNITIVGNDFGYSDEEDGETKYCGVLYLNGAANVELSDNVYSPYIEGFQNLYVQGDKYKNVFGTDVSLNGVSLIKDKL